MTMLTLAGAGAGSAGTRIVKHHVSPLSSDKDKWRQFSGSKLVFITENTPPSAGIKKLVDRGDFKKLTGIDVQVIQQPLPIVLQKAEIDMKGGGNAYQMVYSQDKPVTSALADFFEPLDGYMKDKTLPQDPSGYGQNAWLPGYFLDCAYAYTKSKIIALPFDSADSVFMYRRDLFEKYDNQFRKEFGKSLEYTHNSNYNDVLRIAQFFAALRKKGEKVPYGMGLHVGGTFDWTVQLDLQRVMYSHGQWLDFENFNDDIGSKTPGKTNWGDEQSILGLDLYNKLFKTSTPDQLALDVIAIGDAYRAGKVVMLNQYHEFAASFEDPKGSVAAGGKTAYDLCPKGSRQFLAKGSKGKLVNGTNCGIGGISINAAASKDQKKAAWLFVVWSTMAQTQHENLLISGGTPTRTKTLEFPDLKNGQGRRYPNAANPTGRVGPSKSPNALTFPAAKVGMSKPNVVFGPKIPKINEYLHIVAVEAQKMCAGKQTPEATAKSIQKQVDKLHGH
jgi:multiple sugar transport system substrate-binding protein